MRQKNDMTRILKTELEIPEIVTDGVEKALDSVSYLQMPNKTQTTRKKLRVVPLAAIISAILIITVAAAGLGSFDLLKAKLSPEYQDMVREVGLVSEDEGIRVEVIAGEKFDTQAIIYLSLQDTSGQNRLNKDTRFDGAFNSKAWGEAEEGVLQTAGSFGWIERVMEFDQETNTLYLEVIITGDAIVPIADPLKMSSDFIMTDRIEYWQQPLDIDLGSLDEPETISASSEHIGSVSGGITTGVTISREELEEDFTKAILPGKVMEMPHGDETQWISGIGVVDGKLHVQTCMTNQEYRPYSNGQYQLLDKAGNIIECWYSADYLADENFMPLGFLDHFDDAAYRINETVFNTDISELSDYKLLYIGSIDKGIYGSWEITTELSDSGEHTRSWESDIPVNGYTFDSLSLSPLEFRADGFFDGEDAPYGEWEMGVEIGGEVTWLENGGALFDFQSGYYRMQWRSDTPMDVENIQAVIIDGVRIELY